MPRTTISPHSPVGIRLPSSSIISTSTKTGRAAAAQQAVALGGVGEGLQMVGGRQDADGARALGLAVDLGHAGAEEVDRLGRLVGRHRRAAIDEVVERRIVELVRPGVGQHHVDHRRRHEGMGHAVAVDRLHDGQRIGLLDADRGAAEGHGGPGEDAGAVGHRGRHQVHRRLLDRQVGVGVGAPGLPDQVRPHRALGPAGGAAGGEVADDRIAIVRELRCYVAVARDEILEGGRVRPCAVEADEVPELWALGANLRDDRLEARIVEEPGGLALVDDVGVLVRRRERREADPDAAGACRADPGLEGAVAVGAEDGDPIAGLEAARDECVGGAVAAF